MIIDYSDYTYYDLNNENKGTYKGVVNGKLNESYASNAFDPNKFNNMIAERNYKGAADYASQYKFNNNPEKQKQLDDAIIKIRQEGRVLGAIYSRIKDPDDLAKIEFYDKVFQDGGLENAQNNPYAKKFTEWKKQFGSPNVLSPSSEFAPKNDLLPTNIFIPDNNKDYKDYKEATKLSIRIPKKEQLGLFGWDWEMPDNKYDINYFYETSGLTEQTLKANGVNIKYIDGDTILEFSKSNSLCNKILATLPHNRKEHPGEGPGISGADEWINIIRNGFKNTLDPVIIGLDDEGNQTGQVSMHELTMFQNYINDAKDRKETLFEKNNLNDKLYHSTVGAALDDNIEYYNNLLTSGQITEADYQKMIGREIDTMTNMIKAVGNRYEMYSNGYNEEYTNETLEPIEDEKQKSELLQMISAADPGKVHFHSMVSNGKIGTLITIDAVKTDSKNLDDDPNKNTPENAIKVRKYSIFMPGLFQEICQQKINQDTSTRAGYEINQMQDYNYSYDLQDGTEITPDGQGNFIHNGEIIDKDSAVRLINKAMAIEDGVTNLKYQFINKNNGFINKDDYEETAKVYAVKVANELYPNIPVNNVEEVFSKKGTGNQVAISYENEMNYEQYNKYNEIYDIYTYLMQAISFYN